MNPIRILVYFAVWKRHDILRTCIDNLFSLVNYNPAKYRIIPFAVCSAKEDEAILKDYGIQHAVFPNDRLGAKKNFGLEAAMKANKFDYMLEIGSDDIISGKLLDLYEPYFREKIVMISTDRCFFFCTQTGRIATWTSDLIIGAGRCIHVSLLERMYKREFIFNISIGGLDFSYRPKQVAWLSYAASANYEKFGYGQCTGKNVFVMWNPDKQQGLDTDSYFQILMSGAVEHKRISTSLPLIIDLKSEDNIHSFEKFTPIPMLLNELLEHFPVSVFDSVLNLLPFRDRPTNINKANDGSLKKTKKNSKIKA